MTIQEKRDGLCACGCGGQTKVITQSCALRGYIKGEFHQFISGHNPKRPPKTLVGPSSDSEVARIPLTQGYFAIVDVDDYERVSKLNWHAAIARRADGSILNVYAKRNQSAKGAGEALLLHRFILGVNDPTIEVDHKNHSGLDCRRNNLRPCSRSQNQGNALRRLDNKSGSKGVYWHKATGKWAASIQNEHLGLFDSEHAAANAYDKVAVERFGEFAKVNGL